MGVDEDGVEGVEGVDGDEGVDGEEGAEGVGDAAIAEVRAVWMQFGSSDWVADFRQNFSNLPPFCITQK